MYFAPVLRRAAELGIGLTAIATLILAGCGGGSSSSAGGGGSVASTTTTVTPYKGRFSSGTVGLTDANGQAVTLTAGGTINASGVASVSFPSSVTYPLTVNVAGTYLDETTGASATMATGSPLMGLIPSASDAAAASGIPVTAVTHIARGMLPASGFSSASAVAAISGAASSVLGVGYSDAMLPPVFNGSGQTSDPTTLKLTALAHVIGQQGGGGDLGARLNNVAANLAAGSAVDAVLPQGNLNNALAALNQIGGASGVVPSGATPPTIPNFNPPGASLGNQIQAGIPVCAQGQVLMPTATGLQCVAAGGGTGSVCVDPWGAGIFKLADANGGAFPATINVGGQLTLHITTLSNPATSSYTVAFDTATTPIIVQPSAVNLTTSTLTVIVPQGATGGVRVKDTCANNEAYQSGVFQIGQPATVAPSTPTGLTATPASASQISLNWTAVAGATGYNVYRGAAAGVTISPANKLTAIPRTVANFNDTGLSVSTPYYYTVTAVNAIGESAGAAEVNATIPVGMTLTAPTGLTATVVNNQIDLNWTAVPNAAKYWVFQSVDQLAWQNITVNSAPTNPSYSVLNLTPGTTHYFRVRAVDAQNFGSSDSAIVQGTIGAVVGTKIQMGGAIQGTPVNPFGAISSIAGSVGWGSLDGVGTAASFGGPSGITSDGTHLYVADNGNKVIRRIVISTGEVTTLAGSMGVTGTTDGVGSAARFSSANGITTDGTNLYVTDGNSVRKIVISTGEVTTLAGVTGYSATVNGVGSAARFSSPVGITCDGPNLYVADSNHHVIRKIVIATATVSTLAGGGTYSSYAVDGIGAAAKFDQPTDLTTDGTNLYVSDSGNYLIRKIVISTAEVTTFAGTGGLHSTPLNGTGLAAGFNFTKGITTDGTNLFVADGDRILRKIVISTGVVTTVAGTTSTPGMFDGGVGTGRFGVIKRVTTDGVNVFATDGNAIRKLLSY